MAIDAYDGASQLLGAAPGWPDASLAGPPPSPAQALRALPPDEASDAVAALSDDELQVLLHGGAQCAGASQDTLRDLYAAMAARLDAPQLRRALDALNREPQAHALLEQAVRQQATPNLLAELGMAATDVPRPPPQEAPARPVQATPPVRHRPKPAAPEPAAVRPGAPPAVTADVKSGHDPDITPDIAPDLIAVAAPGRVAEAPPAAQTGAPAVAPPVAPPLSGQLVQQTYVTPQGWGSGLQARAQLRLGESATVQLQLEEHWRQPDAAPGSALHRAQLEVGLTPCRGPAGHLGAALRAGADLNDGQPDLRAAALLQGRLDLGEGLDLHASALALGSRNPEADTGALVLGVQAGVGATRDRLAARIDVLQQDELRQGRPDSAYTVVSATGSVDLRPGLALSLQLAHTLRRTEDTAASPMPSPVAWGDEGETRALLAGTWQFGGRR